MRIQTLLRVAAAAFALILVLVACSQNPVGIFASIEREREILDDERGLPADINVAAMTEAGGKYFIAAGTLVRPRRQRPPTTRAATSRSGARSIHRIPTTRRTRS